MPGPVAAAASRLRAARRWSIGLLLAAASCHSAADDPRVQCADLADRRVGRPEFWDRLLIREGPAVRAAAARAAGETRDVRLSGAVMRALDVEERDDVRAEQLFALGQIADPASTAVLLKWIDANVPALRAAAVEALGKLKIANTVATLTSHVFDPEPEVRGATLLALARIAGRRNTSREPLDADSQSGLLRGAAALLEDPDAGVRWKAAYALAEIEIPGRVPALRRAAASPDLETRFFGTSGLVRIAASRPPGGEGEPATDPEERPTAADFLPGLKDASPHVAALAASGLGWVGGSAAVAPLAATAGGSGPPSRWHAQRAAVAALAQIVTRLGATLDAKAKEAALAAIRMGEESASLSVATESMRAALSLASDPAAVPLRDLEASPGASRTSFGRVARIHALSGGKFEQSGPLLLRLAADSDPFVASEALDALNTFAVDALQGPPRDDARLKQLAEVARRAAASSDPAVAGNALQLLKVCGTKEDLALVADVCARLPSDESAEARVDAIHTAAALAGKEAQAMLRTARADPSPSVVAAAEEEWKKLGFPEEPPPPPRLSGPPVSASDGGGRRSSVALEPGVDFLSSRPNPRVVLHFAAGDVVIELLREQAPHHVKMLLERVRAGLCDGLPIHRVVTGFVVQGLDPRGDGWGTGGLFLRDEINREPYLRGTVGMPNAGPDSGGCQLFVTVVPTPHLDGRYTVFGRVVSGMDVVDALDVSNVCTQAEVIP
jgi:cyclophilin family peptidyl-prolyl cis-trans isomerase/HEAT repeat protein